MAGAPTKYKAEYCDMIVEYFSIQPQYALMKKEYFQNGTLKSETPILTGCEFPTFQGFADKIGVHFDTLHEWKKEHQEFSDAYMRAKQLQEKIWLVNGMGKLYDGQFAKFFGVNCLGYKDKVETANTNYNVEMESVINEVEQMVKNDTE